MPVPSGPARVRATARSSPIAMVALLCGAAIALSACGSSVKPTTGSRGKIDDPRTAHTNHVKCLTNHHLHVQKVGLNEILVEPQLSGPRIVFEPTPGMAQGAQISGSRTEQGAEVIGSALVYPNAASDKETKVVENCISEGIVG
jgi:hypothetical protein